MGIFPPVFFMYMTMYNIFNPYTSLGVCLCVCLCERDRTCLYLDYYLWALFLWCAFMRSGEVLDFFPFIGAMCWWSSFSSVAMTLRPSQFDIQMLTGTEHPCLFLPVVVPSWYILSTHWTLWLWPNLRKLWKWDSTYCNTFSKSTKILWRHRSVSNAILQLVIEEILRTFT